MLVDWLRQNAIGGYLEKSPAASEPIAWAALALHQAKATELQEQELNLGAEWLVERQQPNGAVGVTIDQSTPGWPTSLAIKVWQTIDPEKYAESIQKGIDWALAQKPWTRPKHDNFGHDTMLEGWSWAPDTHSWLEPTSFFVLAFQSIGQTSHPRYKQSIAMLVDRLLPAGGANYGNTIILGQELLQHLQPTGIVAWALAEEVVKPVVAEQSKPVIDDPRLDRTINFLRQAIKQPTGVASLSYAVLGLTAHHIFQKQEESEQIVSLLDEASQRALTAGGLYRIALVTLAIQAMLRFIDDRTGEKE